MKNPLIKIDSSTTRTIVAMVSLALFIFGSYGAARLGQSAANGLMNPSQLFRSQAHWQEICKKLNNAHFSNTSTQLLR